LKNELQQVKKMLKERRFFIMFFSIILFIIALVPSVIGKFLLAPTGSLKLIGRVI
jgi:hypothetical protein